MESIDYTAPATVRLSSRSIQGRAVLAGLDGVPLSEAVRAVMEDLDPWQARFSLIETATGPLRLEGIAEIYNRSDFPGRRPV
jgi:hypothetical protein